MDIKKIFLLGWLIILCLVSVFSFSKAAQGDSVVASINGESITLKELESQMKLNRALVYNLFLKKHSVPQESFSWDGNYSGKIPSQVLKEKSLEDMYKVKIQLLLMKEKGIIKDISYQAFLEELEKINKSRNEAVEKGIVVYGPVSYNERSYFDHSFNTNLQKLKEILVGKEIIVNEFILKSRYDSLKYKQFKKENLLTVERYYIPFDPQTEGALLKDKFYHLVAGKMQNKIVGEKLIQEVNVMKNVPFKVVLETLTIDLADRNTLELYPVLVSGIKKMNYENISNVIEEEESLSIVRVIKTEDRGCWSYAEVEGYLKLKYIDEKYEELILKKSKEAKIELNEGVIKKIVVN